MLENIKRLPKKQWPKRLLEIPRIPKRLWISGTLPNEHYKWLTIVGSRRFTQYGEDICRMLIGALRGKPVVIVSGLAIGIDSIALEAGLDAGLSCVGIPGSGLDPKVLYPYQSVSLAERMITENGCLLSEFPPHTTATNWLFPQRNRIMAGLAHAVLIIEATEKSGTLITAKLATDFNRDVLTIPGSLFSQSTTGPHQLIRNGATPITCTQDLLEALDLDDVETPQDFHHFLDTLSDSEKKIVESLLEPKSRERLTKELNMSQDTINELLSSLEIRDIIKESGGLLRVRFER